VSAGRQLVLEFPHRPALGKTDFLVSDCNMDAVGWIDRWPDWPGPALAVYGPPGCGKTHLAHVWRNRSGAVLISGPELGDRAAPDILGGADSCAVDDADALSDEEALLHLYNHIAEIGGKLLLAGRHPPARWPLKLADLSSRVAAAQAVEIRPPDDELLGALLVKLFYDRQLTVSKDVLVYLLARMERSFAAASAIVEALDQLGLAERRGVTVPLARTVLNELETNSDTNGED
jgi:chromosomal replication initiation ATPase DnaA